MADEVIQPAALSGTPVSLIQSGADTISMPGAQSVSLDTNTPAEKPKKEEALKDDAPKDPPKEGDPKEEPKKDDAPKEEAKEADKPKTLAEAKPEDVERVKANLKEAGGFYADERYEGAALEFELLGEVTPETITKTATAFGVPEDMVKEFINGAKASRDLQATRLQITADEGQKATDMLVGEIHSMIPGGKDGFAPFMGWAKENIPAADRQAYDALLDTNPAGAKLVLQGFVDKFKASGNGGAPRDLTQEGGKGTSSAGSNGYASQAEMEADMNDPRYRQGDTAFHAQVRERLAHSKW